MANATFSVLHPSAAQFWYASFKSIPKNPPPLSNAKKVAKGLLPVSAQINPNSHGSVIKYGSRSGKQAAVSGKSTVRSPPMIGVGPVLSRPSRPNDAARQSKTTPSEQFIQPGRVKITPTRPALSTALTHDPTKHELLTDVFWPGDSQVFHLPSGDRLSYARLGRQKEQGQVWVVFHGTPGCRLSMKNYHMYAESHGIRLIVIDRPGYGYSSLHNRGMLGFIQDVEHLLDYLKVQTFKALGVSGGGPYILAAAYHFPKSRLEKACIMCGATHPSFAETSVDIWWRLNRRLHIVGWGSDYNFIAKLHEAIFDAKGDEKKEHLAKARTLEMSRQGQEGYHNDIKLFNIRWGFELQDIDSNTVRWYHGTLDSNTSVTAAQSTVQLANRHRKNVQYIEVPGCDHYSLQHKKHWEMLDWMTKGETKTLGAR